MKLQEQAYNRHVYGTWCSRNKQTNTQHHASAAHGRRKGRPGMKRFCTTTNTARSHGRQQHLLQVRTHNTHSCHTKHAVTKNSTETHNNAKNGHGLLTRPLVHVNTQCPAPSKGTGQELEQASPDEDKHLYYNKTIPEIILSLPRHLLTVAPPPTPPP